MDSVSRTIVFLLRMNVRLPKMLLAEAKKDPTLTRDAEGAELAV